MKRFLWFCLAILLIIAYPSAALASDVVLSPAPALKIAQSGNFLNGESAYTFAGNTNLTDYVTDALRDLSRCDVALITADCIKGSIPAGEITIDDLKSALSDDELVTTTITGSGIMNLLYATLFYSEGIFAQFSGMEVACDQYLTNGGIFAGEPTRVTVGEDELYPDKEYTIVTTNELYEALQGVAFSESAERFGKFRHAITKYLRLFPDSLKRASQADERMITFEDSINPSEIIAKLNANAPDDVVLNLKHADTLPETVLYALSGQQRSLVCNIMGGMRMYTLEIDGENIGVAADVSLECEITHEVPNDYRRASSADDNVLYLDFSMNSTLPDTTALTFYIGDLQQPGTEMFLYYYDSIHDIVLASNDPYTVSSDGSVTIDVSGGRTYFLNPYRLDSTMMFDLPRADNPFIPGIIVIFILFALFCIVFLRTRKNKKPGQPPQA